MSHTCGEPNAYFMKHYHIVSQLEIQVTITTNPILHKLVPLHLKLVNFNLKNCAWSRLRLVVLNGYKLGIVQNLQTSHDVDTDQKFSKI